MGKRKILIADDEVHIRKLVADFLVRKGFEIIQAKDGDEALHLFNTCSASVCLVILDVMMPGKDGWQVLNEIRKTGYVPVIMLTAKGEETDELIGFELGADDYIHKPFSPSVLVARVEALLKRADLQETHEQQPGGIMIDKDAHKAFVDGEGLDLTPKEYELLYYLVENERIALSREKILNAVWDHEFYGDLRTVDTHIKQLRAKMGEKGGYIQTVRGLGYRFEVEHD